MTQGAKSRLWEKIQKREAVRSADLFLRVGPRGNEMTYEDIVRLAEYLKQNDLKS